MIERTTQNISTCIEKNKDVISKLKSPVAAFDAVKTEDIPGLLTVLSWGIPEERKIINRLCRVLRERKQLHLLIDVY
jgi:hypothetical protein